MENAAYEIKHVSTIGHDLAHVKVKKRQGFEKFSRRTNVILGAFVTAYARIFMHKNLQKITEASQIGLYSDTDSFIIARKTADPTPLEVDQAVFGKFKHEKKPQSIKYFYSLGYVSYVSKLQQILIIIFIAGQKTMCSA